VRSLPPLLEAISLGETERRAPAFRVDLYDLRSSLANTIGDIVTETALELIVGPKDFTDFAAQIDIQEVSGDYTTGGISAGSATVTLEDPTGIFNPLSLLTATTTGEEIDVTGDTGGELEEVSNRPVSIHDPNVTREVRKNGVALTEGTDYDWTTEGIQFIAPEPIDGEDYEADYSQDLDARYFRKGNVLRVYEGDEQVDPDLWPNTLTMIIRGQPSWIRSRALGPAGKSQRQFKATSREADFLGYERTSREFTDGETYRAIGDTLAQSEMGLAPAEIEFSGWGETRVLRHTTMTLSGESPIVLLARVMFADGFIPRFTGEGKLGQHLSILGGNIDRFYSDQRTRISVEWPLSDVIAADSVCIKGLDFNQSKITQPRQVVAQVNLTTGFFADNERIEALFSDDRTQLADNPKLVVKTSVNGGFKALGGGERATGIVAPNDLAEGYVGMLITVDTGFAPWLAVILLIIHVVFAAIPDGAALFVTISIGRIIQAFALVLGLWIMNSLGRGVYDIHADPFEYVFQEIKQIARTDEALEFSESRIEVVNHLIDDDATAIVLAREVLFMQQATLHPRTIAMFHDLALEPADSFSSTDDDRIYLIRQMSRTLKRDAKTVNATIQALEITSGIEVV